MSLIFSSLKELHIFPSRLLFMWPWLVYVLLSLIECQIKLIEKESIPDLK